MSATLSRYPSSLSQAPSGPSRPSRTHSHQAYPSPSIDDEVPPIPPPLGPSRSINTNTDFGSTTHTAPSLLSNTKSKPLNPNSQPYLPKYQRSAPDLHYIASHSSHSALSGNSTSRAERRELGGMNPDGTFIYPTLAIDSPQRQLSGTGSGIGTGPTRQEYSSLQHLLEQAGYAETRIHTPPAERVAHYARSGAGGVMNGRRIKKTFDEVDVDEVRDLYSTFGLGYGAGQPRGMGTGTTMGMGTGANAIPTAPSPLGGERWPSHSSQQGASNQPYEHRITHITTPAIPLKSSTSLLRDVALQDIAHQSLSPPSGHAFPPHMHHPDGTDRSTTVFDPQQQQHWWNGFGVLGRAAKAVRDLSPTKEAPGFDFGFVSSVGAPTAVATATGPNEVGLGLAKGGEGIKKAKSAMQLGRYGGDERDQEQIAPFAFNLGASAATGGRSDLTDAPPALCMPTLSTQTSTATTRDRRGGIIGAIDDGAPRHVNEDEYPTLRATEGYDYSPLPADYEAQCEDDEFFSTSFDVGYDSERSFGESSAASRDASPGQTFAALSSSHMTSDRAFANDAYEPREEQDEEPKELDEADVEAMFAAMSRDDSIDAASVKSLGFGLSRTMGMGMGLGMSVGMGVDRQRDTLGSRIMKGAVGLDDYDESPTKANVPLPEQSYDYEETPTKPRNTVSRPALDRASTTPTPSSVVTSKGTSATAVTDTASETTDNTAPSVEKRPLKYGDRATKLRLARSTPAFTHAPISAPAPVGWMASIRSYVLSSSTYSAVPAQGPSHFAETASSVAAPMRLTPAVPAAPAVARSAAVVCDSTSDMAEDLPAIPTSVASQMAAIRAARQGKTGTPQEAFSLRLRPSLAKMRSVVFGPPPPVPSATASIITPMLSPRMDLAEGEAFAGWSPVRVTRDSKGKRVICTPKKGAVDLASNQGCEEGETDGYGTTVIDYTKSFFYKPCTPPAPGMRESGSEDSAEGVAAMSSIGPGPGPATRNGGGAQDAKVAKRQQSIKSLRKALLIPVAPSAPPVPTIPAQYAATSSSTRSSSSSLSSKSSAKHQHRRTRHSPDASVNSTMTLSSLIAAVSEMTSGSAAQEIPQLRTPPTQALGQGMPEPPMLAILSPGAWEAGLPPRELVLEDEDWDAKRDRGQEQDHELEGDDGVEVKRKDKGKRKRVRRKGSSKSVKGS